MNTAMIMKILRASKYSIVLIASFILEHMLVVDSRSAFRLISRIETIKSMLASTNSTMAYACCSYLAKSLRLTIFDWQLRRMIPVASKLNTNCTSWSRLMLGFSNLNVRMKAKVC